MAIDDEEVGTVLRTWALASCLLTVTAGIAGCTGDDPQDEPEPTKSTASPTPEAAPQPEGPDGVTMRFDNWDEYADDDVVLAWKQTYEATGASINAKKLVPAFRRGTDPDDQARYTKIFSSSWAKDYTVKPDLIGHVLGVKRTGTDQAVATMCVWAPSTDLYDGNEVAGGAELIWRRFDTPMTKTARGWWADFQNPTKQCEGLRAP